MENKLKCRPVMLPTQDLTAPFWIASNEIMHLRRAGTIGAHSPTGNQHLHLVSDREIKEGDWTYDEVNNRIHKFEKGDFTPSYRKIEATTDGSLDPPPIPQQWIEGVYVAKQGKVDEVYLKMIGYNRSTTWEHDEPEIYELDTTNGEVIILPSKESWNREEVKSIARKAFAKGVEHGCDTEPLLTKTNTEIFDEWFDKKY